VKDCGIDADKLPEIVPCTEVLGTLTPQPEARSRVNAFYMTSCFVGAALGSATAALVYGAYGWGGVCVLGAGFGLASTLWWSAGPWARAATGH